MNDVTRKFSRKLQWKWLKQCDRGYDRLFNKMMDDCERLGYNPLIEDEAK